MQNHYSLYDRKHPYSVSRVSRFRKLRAVPCVLTGCPWFLGKIIHDRHHAAGGRLFEKGLNPMEAASIAGHKTQHRRKRYTDLKAKDLVRGLR